MNISKERLKRLLRAWSYRFGDQFLGAMTRLGTIASLMAALGLTMANVPYASLLFVAIFAYICWLAYRSLPTFHVHPSEIANTRIELEELDTLLMPVKCIGLLGPTLVGKTTFLNSATARKREFPQRQTEKPYAVVVQLPDTKPPQYIGLIDSVGQQDYSQYTILERTDLVCLFIDHNAKPDQTGLQRRRLQEHRRLLRQLIRTKADAETAASKVVLVANKYDLWGQDEHASRSMQSFFSECQRAIENSNVFSLVGQMPEFTATSGDDPAQLLEVIKHAP